MKPPSHARSLLRSGPSKAIGICLFLLIASLQPLLQPNLEPPTPSSRATFFLPSRNQTGVNLTHQGMLNIPANQTFVDGVVEIGPVWSDAGSNNPHFGIEFNSGWTGDHNGTQGIGHGGQLSLAPSSTLATLTDFESLIETMPNWVGEGANHVAWNVVTLTGTPQAAGQPSAATQGQRVLATQALGGIEDDMIGCLASPTTPVPAFVSNFNVTFDHWESLYDDDAAWIDARVNGGQWQVLSPNGGYTNASTLSNAPSSVWSGQSSVWQTSSFFLDSMLPQNATEIEFRFCFATSSSAGVRYGWFIDNFTVSNQGDLPGAWFHGNMSGSYANNANGRMYIPANFSGYTGSLDLEFWANWDLEGAFADNLLVTCSLDNGTTWQTVSGIPGLPGNGYSSQGNFYMDESLGWVPVQYSLPTSIVGHQNSSHVLIEFHVQTNAQTGFGGFASSGWEGIAIDNIVAYHQLGTPQEVKIPLANFSTNSSDVYGDPNGWLDHTAAVNEWIWTTSFGMNGPQTTRESFETTMVAPAGWGIEGTWPGGWEIGATKNTSGYGPGVFHSGNQGAAINLTTLYTSDIYTHLVTQEYAIPTNATARLSFRSWICSEANWDGGAVSLSTDGGQTWWWLPANVNGFHDQISTVNTNSPLFGQGIIDGSKVPNGCNTNKNRPYELKTYDVSNLSGQTVRARFSFFSDAFVEADGWYIDDAGIEIDVFELQGNWTSLSLQPDPLFGYGWLDGWFEEPEGTTLRIDILDAFDEPIFGHQNLSLPASLALDPIEYPAVKIRVKMTTNDSFVTPLIHSLTMGQTTYIDTAHLLAYTDVANVSSVNDEGDLVVSSGFSISLSERLACSYHGFRMTTQGDNVTWTTSGAQLTSTAYISSLETTYRNYSFGGTRYVTTSFSLQASGGSIIHHSKVELDCVRPTVAPSLNLGWTNASIFTWPEVGMSPSFGLNTDILSVQIGASTVAWRASEPSPSYELENSTIDFSFLTVERNNLHLAPNYAGLSFVVSNYTEGSSILVDGQEFFPTTPFYVFSTTTTSACPARQFVRAYSANFSLNSCSVSVEINGSASVKLLNIMHLSSSSSIQMTVNATTLNTAKQASETGDVRAVLSIPLLVHTQAGGVRVDMSASSLPLMVERVDPPTYVRWLPNMTVAFTSTHLRENPLDPTQDAPDITLIDFYLASSSAMTTTFVHVQLDHLDHVPRFRQLSGAGLAQFKTEASSVNCAMNQCSVEWVLTSTWLMDDVDDLYVLAQATDSVGLQAGPTVMVRKTPFNEIENDLEVVDFTITDEQSRRLDDWTNSFWPYHLRENQSMVAQGRVRMEGIANQWIGENEAEVTVTMRAVPPKNLSGGPDTWPDTEVTWSATWNGNVDENGRFSIAINSPTQNDGVPSNTWLEIRPSLSRRGPVAVNASTSEDRTVLLMPTRILHDTLSPQISSLTVLDSGQVVPADEHIVMVGKNIPLRLEMSDNEGLGGVLEVWTWFERSSDANGNAGMDEEEYLVQLLSINRGVKFIEIDLPLIAANEVIADGAFQGRLSIVVRGQDLAGNPLLGGGDFGLNADLATIYVQQRADTISDSDEVWLDTVNGHLLAGHLHTLEFSLADGNGISSLEEIQIELLGEQTPDSCFIVYEPRFGAIDYDEDCFLQPPSVVVQRRQLSQTYDIKIQFRLDWNESLNLSQTVGIPSIHVQDEGQDIGIGLHQLNALAWTPSTDLEMRWRNITDTVAPFGDANETTHWFHRNDVAAHEIGIYHANTTVLARDVPETGWVSWTLSDGERSGSGQVSINASGLVNIEVLINPNIMYHDYGTLRIIPHGYDVFNLNGLAYTVILDDVAPKLVLAPGMLETVSSNALGGINITVSIQDDTQMPPGPLKMHAVFYRMGKPLESTRTLHLLDVSEVVNAFTVYAGVIDFNPGEDELLRSDVLLVWFEASDRSGRPLSGLGTQLNPLQVDMRWVAFEPVFTDLSATPYRPEIGDNVMVFVRVGNDGLLPGQTQVLLRDDEGNILENTTIFLNTTEWVNIVWYVEAWKVGRLGLTVQLESYSPQVPIPLADIQPRSNEESTSSMALLSLSVLALIVATLVLFLVRKQREEKEEEYHLERIRRIVYFSPTQPVSHVVKETKEEQ